MLFADQNTLHWRYDAEHLKIEPWGENAFRIRCVQQPQFPAENWALSYSADSTSSQQSVNIDVTPLSEQPTPPAVGTYITEPPKQCPPASITNGNIRATITPLGKITIHSLDPPRLILEEYTRNRLDILDPKTSALEIPARDFKSHPTGSSTYHLTYRLESLSPNEQLYGMGQYQQPHLNLKGLDLELAHRNSQASIPFLISSLGYGLLWNNPAIGRAVLSKNTHSFEAYATNALDYWIVAPPKPSPKSLLSAYANATGHAPAIPSFALGFWQSKLRYQTQDEILSIAREYKRRNLPLSVLVVDFFHWPLQGTWRFDPAFFPDPDSMIAELTALDIKLLVSIWPTVDRRSENYAEMLEKGLLIRSERGVRTAMEFMGNTVHADFTNPEARAFVWAKCKQNYWDKGVRTFWLDEAEPEYARYDYENWRYWQGTDCEVGNVYPVEYARAFWDGQCEAGQPRGEIVNLIRCAWAGSQRFGALLWSGDIASSWGTFRNQVAAGLNVGLAGVPWWTTDIGGFHGGETKDERFRELLVRWFQWGCFCPVMRLHGSREPIQDKVGEGGGSDCRSGADNEVWSFGDHNYPVLVKYLRLRERLRGYVAALMEEASKWGWPVMRTMFFEFAEDDVCWSSQVEEQYMFGHKYLCAPVMQPEQKKMKVYLPKKARWAQLVVTEDGDSLGEEHEGGKWIEVDLTIADMPVFVRAL